MAVWSVVKYSELTVDLRFDAEYYQPTYLEYALAVSDGDLLADITTISHPAEIKRIYEDNGIQILLAQNVRANRLDFSNVVYMPESVKKQLARNKLLYDDVLMTRSGANFGESAVYKNEPEEIYACADVLVIRCKEIRGSYLSTYFNTKVGRALLTRGAYGMAQPHIAPNYLYTMRLPRLGNDFEQSIDYLVNKSYEKRNLADNLYAEAEALLLHELGLDTLDLSTQKTYVANFSETVEGDRFDAEYFQPKYYRVIDTLKSLKVERLVPLGILLESITNGQTPLHHDLSEGDITFLTAEHILDFRINYDSDKRVLKEHHDQKLQKTQLREKDVLITIKGRIGNAAVVENLLKPVNINQDVALLRLRDEYHPYYIAGFINSLAGKALTEQIGTGQINPFLGLGNLQKLMIPIFEQSYMDKIGKKVERKVHEACQTQKEAEQLLEQAKHQVEQMILGEHATDDYPS